jgi:hypothetical protein
VSQGNGGPNTTTATVGDSAQVSSVTSGGAISITQGNGNLDKATVMGSTAAGNVSISQGNGNSDTALIDPTVSGGSVTITQGNGNNDTATINLVTAANTVTGTISITQGNGNNDAATVMGSTAGANISISQGNGNSDTALIDPSTAGGTVTITQGNGNSDTATVNLVTAGGAITISQGNGNTDLATVSSATTGDSINITQGQGNSDSATVTASTVTGNITITQGNGTTDMASVLGTKAGSPATEATTGLVTITQGNGAGDVATLDMAPGVPVANDVVNNVVINQGNASIPAPGTGQGSGGSALGDTANINDYTITSNITITQGVVTPLVFGAAPVNTGAGNNNVNIGTTSPVTAGGMTVIAQGGAANTVVLGTSGSTGTFGFTTFFLDIYTGAGGGAFVVAEFTDVVIGPLGWFSAVGPYVIEGGGADNFYFDAGGNVNVTADPAFFNQF